MVAVMLLLLALAVAGAALIGSGVIRLPVLVEISPTPSEPNDTTPEAVSGRIAFGRYDTVLEDFVVYLIDPDGSSERLLLPGAHECPRWSPDGQDISLGSGIFENAGQPNGSFRAFGTFADPIRFLPDPTLNLACPVWSPDGNRLAYEGWDDTDPTRNGIYTLSALDGSDLQRLTSSPDGGHDVPGAYSADGSQLFYARWDGIGSSGPLMVAGRDGSDPQEVSTGSYGVPSLSPDGETLVAVRDDQLYLIAVDGSSATPIAIPDSTFAGDFGPSWSPDGGWIVFQMVSRTTGAGNIARVRPDGSGLFQVTDNPADEAFPDWAR